MRLSLTVVAPGTGDRQDVVLEADGGATLGEVVGVLAAVLREARRSASAAAPLPRTRPGGPGSGLGGGPGARESFPAGPFAPDLDLVRPPTPDLTAPDLTVPDGRVPDGTGPDGTGPDGMVPDGTVPDGTGAWRAGPGESPPAPEPGFPLPRARGGETVVSLAVHRAARQAAEEAARKAELDAADRALGPAGAIRGYVAGELLDPAAPLAGSPVRDGAVLSLGDPSGCVVPEPVGAIDLRVTNGPGAGVVHRLVAGEWTLGASATSGITLDDPDLGPAAATLTVRPDGRCLIRGEDGVPLFTDRLLLEGRPVEAPAPWPEGAQLRLGAVTLEVARPTAPDAVLTPAPDGQGLGYTRPGRRDPAAHPSPRLSQGPTELVEREARTALDRERAFRLGRCPDPGALLLTATGPRARLWERRRDDPDHLLLRLGLADQPSGVRVEEPLHSGRRRVITWDARDVPVTVGLREAGVVGIAGLGALPRRLAAWCLGQLAVLQSPHDVLLWVLTDGRAERSWGWLRWLPHARPSAARPLARHDPGADDGPAAGAPACLIGTDPETCARRLAELTAVLAARRAAAARAVAGPGAARHGPDLVVVLDGARRLRSMPGVIPLLREGPALGIHALCLDTDEALLPEECRAVITEHPDGLRVVRPRDDVVERVRADVVSADWPERVARSLAPVRDAGDDADDAALPPSPGLLDLLGLAPTVSGAAAGIAERWRASGHATSAVIGRSATGPVAIDLRRDGPHALVVGAPGAGTSELLRTLVCSLAVGSRPDELTFLLVDRRAADRAGRSAFGDCERLPHAVGVVTELDLHLVQRALTSLGAELRRRGLLLAAAGAADIDAYQELRARDERLTPVPRLVIVVDEFAALAGELPDFVDGLVDLAQRGADLGVHLVLATNRPAGVLSAQVRGATTARIALRTAGSAESAAAIGLPDAAQIPEGIPGRGCLRIGQGPATAFQAARISAPRPDDAPRPPSDPPDPPWATVTGWADLPRPAPRRPRPRPEDDTHPTDLAALVTAIEAAARSVGAARPRSPWLPALPRRLTLAELAPPRPGAGDLPAVPWALQDLPAHQAQFPAVIDPATFGHLVVVGGARTGRSQVLRTVAAALADRIGSADLHLYGLDGGNGALLPLVRLPHCGALVQRAQRGRAQRLLTRLTAELTWRREVLAAGSWADVTEQRRAAPAEHRLPHVVLLVDDLDGSFGPGDPSGEAAGTGPAELVAVLIREGAPLGVHVVLAGDRQLLSGRLSTLTEDKLVLRLPDRTDYAFAGLTPRTVPEELPAGRGFRAGSGIETQVALIAPDPSGPAQAAALEALGARARQRDEGVPRGRRPFRVDLLPARIAFDEAWYLRERREPRPLWAMLGVGGDDLVARGADLAVAPATFLVAGPPGSGRSTALRTMARSLVTGGTQVVVLAPRESPLRDLAGRVGVRGVLTDPAPDPRILETLIGAEDVVLLVDDAGSLRPAATAGAGSADDVEALLAELVRTAPATRRGLVVAGGLDELAAAGAGWVAAVRDNARGVLLAPQRISDGDLVGARLAKAAVGGVSPPGRALLHDGSGDLQRVQIPYVS